MRKKPNLYTLSPFLFMLFPSSSSFFSFFSLLFHIFLTLFSSVHHSFVPEELRRTDGGDIDMQVNPQMETDYVAPKKPFSGTGQRLGAYASQFVFHFIDNL